MSKRQKANHKKYFANGGKTAKQIREAHGINSSNYAVRGREKELAWGK